MQPQSRKLLEDMRDAAAEIDALTSGKFLADYLANKWLRWCVERGNEIVGEAMSQLARLDPATAERITDFRNIISFRNLLIHGYGKVNHEMTWDIVTKDLPKLRHELDELLR